MEAQLVVWGGLDSWFQLCPLCALGAFVAFAAVVVFHIISHFLRIARLGRPAVLGESGWCVQCLFIHEQFQSFVQTLWLARRRACAHLPTLLQQAVKSHPCAPSVLLHICDLAARFFGGQYIN